MSVHLTVVTATGGIPLFTRQFSHPPPDGLSPTRTPGTSSSPPGVMNIPFATLASLNGVNLFSRLNDANLLSVDTGGSKIHWKVYHGALVLIVIITTNERTLEFVDELVIDKTLDYIFDSMVLSCGYQELQGNANVERLKKSLRGCYTLVDYFLKLLISPPYHPNLLKACVTTIYLESTIADFVKSFCESYCQVTSSDMTAIVCGGMVVGASKGWWSRLSPSKDAFLVINLVSSLASIASFTPATKTIEVPVYLPENCPHEITRVVVSEVFPTLFLVVLCGESPSLEEIEEYLQTIRTSDYHQKNFSIIQGMRGVSSLLPIDDRIHSFVLCRDDHHTLLKYGNFDHGRLKDLLTAISVMVSSETSSQPESYVKFRNSTAFRLTYQSLVLIIFVSRDLSLDFTRCLAHKMMTKLRDKKLLSQIN